jgi:hypothetical protein
MILHLAASLTRQCGRAIRRRPVLLPAACTDHICAEPSNRSARLPACIHTCASPASTTIRGLAPTRHDRPFASIDRHPRARANTARPSLRRHRRHPRARVNTTRPSTRRHRRGRVLARSDDNCALALRLVPPTSVRKSNCPLYSRPSRATHSPAPFAFYFMRPPRAVHRSRRFSSAFECTRATH